MSDEQEHKDGQVMPEQPKEKSDMKMRLFFCAVFFAIMIPLFYVSCSYMKIPAYPVWDGYKYYTNLKFNNTKNPFFIDSLDYIWVVWSYYGQDLEPTIAGEKCSIEIYNLKRDDNKFKSLDDVQNYLNLVNDKKDNIFYYKEIDDGHYEVFSSWFQKKIKPENFKYDKKPSEKFRVQSVFESVEECLSEFNEKENYAYLKSKVYPFFFKKNISKEYFDVIYDKKSLMKFFANCDESIVTYYNINHQKMGVENN